MHRFAAILALCLTGWAGSAQAQQGPCLDMLHELRQGDGLLGGPAGLSTAVERALSELETGYLSAAMANVRLAGTPEFAVAPEFDRCLEVTGKRLTYARTPDSPPVLEVPLRILALGNDPISAEGAAGLDDRAFVFSPPARIDSAYPGLRLRLPVVAGKVPKAGSGPFIDPAFARFYRLRATDPGDVSQGVTMLLCVTNCAGALAELPAPGGTDAPASAVTVEMTQPAEPVAPIEEAPAPAPASDPEPEAEAPPKAMPDPEPMAEAPQDAAPADPPGQPSRPEALAPNLPQGDALSPEALERDKFWTERLADLARPLFLLDGAEVQAPGYRFACALQAPFDVATVEDVLLRLYGPDCLQPGTDRLAVIAAEVVPASTLTDRLEIAVTLERRKARALGALTLRHDAGPELFRFCTLTARFAEIVDGMALETVGFTGDAVPFFTGRAEAGFTLPRASIPVPEGAAWRNLAVEIAAPPEAQNQTCRLETPVRLALRDTEDSRIRVAEDGAVTLTGLGIQANSRTVHVILNTSLGAHHVGTAEQEDGVYPFHDRRQLLQYATAYAGHVVRAAAHDSRPVTHVFHTQDAEGAVREVARLTPLDRETGPGWVASLTDRLAAQQVDAGYADARVIAALDALQAAGEVAAGAELHVFGRSGFDDPAGYCDAQAFRAHGDLDLRIVDLAPLTAFPGLDARLGLENAVDAPIRTLRCPDGLPHHIVIFPDSRGLPPTDAELSRSFDGLTAPLAAPGAEGE